MRIDGPRLARLGGAKSGQKLISDKGVLLCFGKGTVALDLFDQPRPTLQYLSVLTFDAAARCKAHGCDVRVDGPMDRFGDLRRVIHWESASALARLFRKTIDISGNNRTRGHARLGRDQAKSFIARRDDHSVARFQIGRRV